MTVRRPSRLPVEELRPYLLDPPAPADPAAADWLRALLDLD